MKRINKKHKTFRIKENVNCLKDVLTNDYKELSNIRNFWVREVAMVEKFCRAVNKAEKCNEEVDGELVELFHLNRYDKKKVN